MDTLKEIEFRLQDSDFLQAVNYASTKTKTNQIYNFEDKIIKKEELSRKHFALNVILEDIRFSIVMYSIKTYVDKKILELYFLENVKKWASLSRKTNIRPEKCKKIITDFLYNVQFLNEYKTNDKYNKYLKKSLIKP